MAEGTYEIEVTCKNCGFSGTAKNTKRTNCTHCRMP